MSTIDVKYLLKKYNLKVDWVNREQKVMMFTFAEKFSFEVWVDATRRRLTRKMGSDALHVVADPTGPRISNFNPETQKTRIPNLVFHRAIYPIAAHTLMPNGSGQMEFNI